MFLLNKRNKTKKIQKVVSVYIPGLVSFICVLFYVITSEKNLGSLISYGVASVLINLLLSSVFVYFNIKDFLDYYGGFLAVIVSQLTLIIPYSLYYILLAFVLSGFKIPFLVGN